MLFAMIPLCWKTIAALHIIDLRRSNVFIKVVATLFNSVLSKFISIYMKLFSGTIVDL